MNGTAAGTSVSDPAAALARGLAAHLRRWAAERGAPAHAAEAAATAAQALSLAMGDGHVCVWLTDLPALVAETTAATATAATALPANLAATADAWRAALQASRVVGSAADPANQPLVLDADGRLYLHRAFDLERRLARRLLQAAVPLPADPVAETAAAARLQALFGRPGGATPDPGPACAPDWQMLAAALALQRRLTVISGGPGTGKTTTVVNLLACLLAAEPQTRVVLAAPTGKAAARLAEALRDRAAHLEDTLRQRLPTGATTVHRLLGVRPGHGGAAGVGEAAFRHDAANPLPLDLLVLDEASMLDLALATRLLEAVPPTARVVLLGDKDQLAAVEAGAVFAELSADPSLGAATVDRLARLCGVPAAAIRPPAPAQAGALHDSVVWFQRNYRFARDSGIGRLAAEILAGDAAAVLATLRAPDGDPQARLVWLADGAQRPAPDTLAAAVDGYAAYVEACLEACRALRPGTPPGATAIAALHAAFARFRVLCALRAGPRGVETVNALLSRRLRAAIAGQTAQVVQAGDAGAAAGIGEAADQRQPWFAGRPVMVLRNDPALRLFNGDIGLAWPGAGGALQVWFPTADGGWHAVPPARLPAHETAWAMTVHKAQGSEFDAVLLLLPAQRSRVLSRELLYTGVTRARQRVLLAGGADVLAGAVQASSQRHAGLRARLQDIQRPD